MAIWKEIRVADIVKNKNEMDVGVMYKAGAIAENKSYKALEVASYDEFVKVLAQLEPGFEEYLVFDKEDYSKIPELKLF